MPIILPSSKTLCGAENFVHSSCRPDPPAFPSVILVGLDPGIPAANFSGASSRSHSIANQTLQTAFATLPRHSLGSRWIHDLKVIRDLRRNLLGDAVHKIIRQRDRG
jgi:hypothetical protein